MAEWQRTGELLKAAGLIDDTQLAHALDEQQRTGGRLGEVLVRQGRVTELQLTQILANQLSVAWVSLEHVEFTPELLSAVPRELAERYNLVPVRFRLGEQGQKILYVAMDDPTNIP